MKINIATSHRFHLLDLARELSNFGHDVRFYSYVPTKRAIKFGIKEECCYSFFVPMLPFLALVKLSRGAYWAIALKDRMLDCYLSWFMRPCDVYIALGTVYEKSLSSAKRKFRSTTILEWGSKHIEEQQRILSAIPSVKKQPQYFTHRSLSGYALADYISIPSDHAKLSFIARGIPESRLIQNPYGVDLSMFRATEINAENPYDIIAVGAWSYQKGYDLLVDVCKKNKFRLLHVGSLVDVEFPQDENFIHIDSVDQSQLAKYYAQARIFVLPSRQDGLAMVQLQALACGLPIVCSMHTGGRDLRQFLPEKKWIVEMQEYTFDELEKCIYQAIQLAKNQNGLRSYAGNAIENLTWAAYGSRYNNKLNAIT